MANRPKLTSQPRLRMSAFGGKADKRGSPVTAKLEWMPRRAWTPSW